MEVSQELARRRRSAAVVAGGRRCSVALALFAIDTGTGGRRHPDRLLRRPAVHRGGRGRPAGDRGRGRRCGGARSAGRHRGRLLRQLPAPLQGRPRGRWPACSRSASPAMRERAELVAASTATSAGRWPSRASCGRPTPRAARDRRARARLGRRRAVGGGGARQARSLHVHDVAGARSAPRPLRRARRRARASTSGIGLPGRVLASGEPAWVDDVQAGPGVRPTRRPRRRPASAPAAAFPITGTRGVRGVIELFSRRAAAAATPALMKAMASVGRYIGQHLERRRARRPCAAARRCAEPCSSPPSTP